MSDDPLGYRRILSLWLPLALSWVMMSIAGPFVSAGLARLPDPTVNLAAYGLTMSIAVLIESPVIMILSTSVALVRSRASYLLLRRFVIHLSLALTSVGLLAYFTPLYDVLFLRFMGVPPAVAQAARPALKVMLLWPMAIAWRRLFQGILIHQGRSKLVGYGTVCRLAALTVTIVAGVWIGSIPGALLGGLGLAISVIVEMLVIAWWTRPLLEKKVLPVPADPEGEQPLNYRRLLGFYWPLAGTAIMRVASRPVASAGIARVAQSTLSLAAWPVGSGLTWLLSASVMALQEVVLALIRDDDSQRRLAIFTLAAGLVFSGLLALLVFTPLVDLYFRSLLRVPPDVKSLAIPVTRILAPLPMLSAGRNLLRGLLIWRRRSGLVQLAMSANLSSLIVFLALGIYFGGLVGALLAAWATLGAQFLEVISLWWLANRLAHRETRPAVLKAARGALQE